MPQLAKYPDYFKSYNWNAKHHLYGYPADQYSDFLWIDSLEKRFAWLRLNCSKKPTASRYLIREMVQWGGSQNGRLQAFDDGIEALNLQSQMADVISNLGNTSRAIALSLDLPGMGLTYASKLLRFLDPTRYGALDRRLRKAFAERAPGIIGPITDGDAKSMVRGYSKFIDCLNTIRNNLNTHGISRPGCNLAAFPGSSTGWRASDIEMALFMWASSSDPW